MNQKSPFEQWRENHLYQIAVSPEILKLIAEAFQGGRLYEMKPKQEQGEPVACIHRNEYNEYRLEPHDNFDIKSIPFNVDVPLFKESQPAQKPLTDDMIVAGGKALAKLHADTCGLDFDDVWKYYSEDHKADAKVAIEAAHSIKE